MRINALTLVLLVPTMENHLEEQENAISFEIHRHGLMHALLPLHSRPEIRVLTIIDIDGGVRDIFPKKLGSELIDKAKEAPILSAVGDFAPSCEAAAKVASPDASPSNTVRLCVSWLRGARVLGRRTFKVHPNTLLCVVFGKICGRLSLSESSVAFVHDGVLLPGRVEAGTLLEHGTCGPAKVFAVCRKAWASRQREAARRGLVSFCSLRHKNTRVPPVSRYVPFHVLSVVFNFEHILYVYVLPILVLRTGYLFGALSLERNGI